MDVCRSPPQQAPEATSFAANKLSVQSYRRSCDRCHVQKLKCSRNTRSPTQCQRCERAGHKCVYSQRNPRQSTRVKGNASSAARGGAGQSHQLPVPAGGDDASSDKLSPEWPGTLDGDAVDLLQEWTWQDFTGGPLGEYHDLLGQTLYSPQTTSTTPLSVKDGITTATTSEQQDVFERLSSISKTLEDYVHFLANQWDRKEIQNYPIGEVFGTFQAFLTTLQVQKPIEKPGVLEGCQHTRTVLLASHCYTVCVKIMEALAETLCQDMSAQASQNALRQPPGDVISASGSEVDFLVGESFSHLHPLASSLVSACTTLHTGVGILCKVEVELGVPWGNSIMAREALPAEGDGDALFPSQKRKGSAGFTQAARFLGVMREGAGSDFGYISNLQNFHRHHAEILRLTRQHTVCFLSKILSPQTTKT